MDIRNAMFYLIENHQVKDRRSLEQGVVDIARKGFDGIILQARDIAFQLDDREIIDAVAIIVRKAHQLGVKCVLTFITTNCRPWFHSFFKRYPCAGDWVVFRGEGRVKDGKFEISTNLPSGTDGGAHIARLGPVVRTFTREGRRFRIVRDLKGDIESAWDCGYNERLEWYSTPPRLIYHGKAPHLNGKELIAYFSLQIGHPDYGSPEFRSFMRYLLDCYKAIPLDGVAWDEPGIPGSYEYYKLSPHFQRRFNEQHGYRIRDKLCLLDYDSEESWVVRHHYYLTLGKGLFEAQADFVRRAKRLFGDDLYSGIHQTWVAAGQSVDLRAGNSDYFYLAKTLSGGFTDCIMSLEKSMNYTVALARSLAKTTPEKVAYHNASECNTDSGRLRHWAKTMCLNRVRLIGHAYGHATGGFGPGFPYSRLWDTYQSVTRLFDKIDPLLKGCREPTAIAVLHPIEPACAVNTRFNEHFEGAKVRIAHELMTNNLPFDFIGAGDLARASVERSTRTLVVGDESYTLLIVPWPMLMTVDVWQRIREFYRAGGQLIFFGPPAERLTDGRNIRSEFFSMIEAKPFSYDDYIRLYYRHHDNPPDANGAERWIDFRYPLRGAGIKWLNKGKAVGIGNRIKPVWYFSTLGLDRPCVPVLKQLGHRPPVRFVSDKPSERVLVKLYYKDKTPCLVATGYDNDRFSGRFSWGDYGVSVGASSFLCLTMKANRFVVDGEGNKDVRVTFRGKSLKGTIR